MKQAIVRCLSAAVLCGMLVTGAQAASLQSGQAVYRLSLDPIGTEPFSYSDTEIYSATLVPVGTRVESDSGALLLVEVFTYSADAGHWVLNSILSGQGEMVVRDRDHLYHIATLAGESGQGEEMLDRGIWLKAPEQEDCQPVSVTGEQVDEWALNLVNEAVAGGLMPDHLKGQDLREPITRAQFAALAVRLYETATGQPILIPEGGENPFLDTADGEVLKAYFMGFTAGVSVDRFAPEESLTREQAAVMLSAVCRALGMNFAQGENLVFVDQGQIASWAQESTAAMAQAGIIAGYDDGRFGPRDTAQRQACLVMALRIFQQYSGDAGE